MFGLSEIANWLMAINWAEFRTWYAVGTFAFMLFVVNGATVNKLRDSKIFTAIMFGLFIESIVTILWS